MLKSAGNMKNVSVAAAAGDIMSPVPGESLLLSLCDVQPSAIWIHNSLLLFALHCSSEIRHKEPLMARLLQLGHTSPILGLKIMLLLSEPSLAANILAIVKEHNC